MDQYQLALLSSKIKIAPENVVREYFEMVILQYCSELNLTKRMIFYGGTALRLAYGGPRFSEDLDFLMIKPITSQHLRRMIVKICQKYSELSLVEIKEKRNTLFACIKIRHTALKHPRHIKIEICKKKNGIQSEYRILTSPCSNFSPLIQTVTLDDLEMLKLKTITERRKPRDWFDVWVIEQLLKKPFKQDAEFPFDAKEFKRELKRFLPMSHWVMIDDLIRNV